MNANNIYLVIGNYKTRELDVRTLDRQIHHDINIWCEGDTYKYPIEWVIISAHDSEEEAKEKIKSMS